MILFFGRKFSLNDPRQTVNNFCIVHISDSSFALQQCVKTFQVFNQDSRSSPPGSWVGHGSR